MRRATSLSPRATVIVVPPEQSADLRDYYFKHAKSDRVDSRILARLPLVHAAQRISGHFAATGPQLGGRLVRCTR